MKRNAWIAAIAAALVSTAVLAGPGPGGDGGGYGYRMGMGGGYGMGMGGGGYAYGMGGGGCGMANAFESLGLSAEQRTRVSTIFDESSARRLALMDEMHELRSQTLRAGTPDYVAMSNVRDRMQAVGREQRERIDAVLTAEQREKLNGGWRGFGPGR